MSTLSERLRELASADPFGTGPTLSDKLMSEAADELDRLTARADALQAELDLRRKSGSATDRLHNLIEGIAADADGSEWSREEWERIDAENAELRKRFEWRPISTAPKDGTRVILSWGETSCVGFFLDNSKTSHPWSGWRTPSMEVRPSGQPTHWLPLPAARALLEKPHGS